MLLFSSTIVWLLVLTGLKAINTVQCLYNNSLHTQDLECITLFKAHSSTHLID